MSKLAKLTPPRLGDTHPRERLFDRLDVARHGSGVWICGPPGSGKTTLVASYLQARQARTCWYEVDSGDGDPATLFHLLRSAVGARRAPSLPAFGPESMANLEGYARRYFRLLYARLPSPLIVVFDNVQEADPASGWPITLRSAMLEAPDEVNVIAVSREEPPAAFARLATDGRLDTLGWDELRLDADEASAIVALQGVRDAQHATRLLERSGGWAAGLRLLARAEAARDGTRLVDVEGMPVPQLLQDYLAGEVFDAAPAVLRKLWLRTAQPPHVTARLACELSADPHAARRLEALWRRRHFVDRIPAAEPLYQYHSLFRAFLLEQLARREGIATRRRRARRAARLLERHGDASSALALYCEGEDWAPAAQLLAREASGLLAAGRLHTLAARIAMLPPTHVARDPWLLLWRGCCKSYAGALAAARDDLADAFRLQSRCGTVVGQCLAATLMLESYFLEWSAFSAVDHWAGLLRGLLDTHPAALADPALELRMQAALLLALTQRAPQDASTAACAQRVLRLCRADVGPADRLNGAIAVLQYCLIEESVANTAQIAAEFDALARAPSTPATQRILWLGFIALIRFQTADDRTGAALLREALESCATQGLDYLVNFVRMQTIWGMLVAADVKSAQRELQTVELALHGLRPIDVVLYHVLRAWLALLENRPGLALEHGGVAARMAPELGNAGPLLAACWVHSQALIACGEPERALAAARVPHALICEPGVGSFRFSALLFEADALLHLQRGKEFLEVLRAGLETGRRGGFLSLSIPLPAMAARLCAAALEAGIETEHVERLIRARNLQPPTPRTEHWPWPVRIRALGGFSVNLDGVALETRGKAQRRPLELLKRLLVHGEQPLDHLSVLDQLWPELDGDAARNAFDVAVHRLRKLLGCADAVRLDGGRLHLDARRVWVDSLAFEHLCGAVEAGTAPTLQPVAQQLLEIYRGPLLPGEDAPWIEPARQRLRRKFEHALGHLAVAADVPPDHALELYRRALDVEPHSESLLRGLLQAHRACGQAIEAERAERRLREMLAR